MNYSSENPIYPKMETYDTRRVQDIQHKLNAIVTYLHYTWSIVSENGMMDDDTRDAIMSFQQWMGFRKTGELDSLTEMKIDDV